MIRYLDEFLILHILLQKKRYANVASEILLNGAQSYQGLTFIICKNTLYDDLSIQYHLKAVEIPANIGNVVTTTTVIQLENKHVLGLVVNVNKELKVQIFRKENFGQDSENAKSTQPRNIRLLEFSDVESTRFNSKREDVDNVLKTLPASVSLATTMHNKNSTVQAVHKNIPPSTEIKKAVLNTSTPTK